METQNQTQTPKPVNPLLGKFPALKETLDTLSWTHDGTVPEGKSAIAVMGEPGDTKHIWDKRKPEEVKAAKALFKSLTDAGYRAYRVTGKDGDRGEQMSEFDPDAERMIMVPAFQGG